jgi:glutamine synthetase type III
MVIHFQPLTGVTAEKHDAFITAPMDNGKVLMSFSGNKFEFRMVGSRDSIS